MNGEMSQQQLAEKVGCTRQTIISLEQDKFLPSLLLDAKIAYIFGVSIEEYSPLDLIITSRARTRWLTIQGTDILIWRLFFWSIDKTRSSKGLKNFSANPDDDYLEITKKEIPCPIR